MVFNRKITGEEVVDSCRKVFEEKGKIRDFLYYSEFGRKLSRYIKDNGGGELFFCEIDGFEPTVVAVRATGMHTYGAVSSGIEYLHLTIEVTILDEDDCEMYQEKLISVPAHVVSDYSEEAFEAWIDTSSEINKENDFRRIQRLQKKYEDKYKENCV